MMCCKTLRASVFLGLLSSLTLGLKAHHNGNRYFPLLEKPEDIVTKKRSSITPEFFFTKASTAHKHGGGNYGLPELWGKYDLQDVVTSLKKAGVITANKEILGSLATDLQNKSLKYRVDGAIHAQGLALGFEQTLPWKEFSVGVWAPVMHISSTSRFSLEGTIDSLGRKLTQADIDKIDQARRLAHDKLGFIGNYWDASGFGDIDVHVRWNYFMDHQLLMRSIDSYVQVGLTIPTGMRLKNNAPLSVPAMGDGHWGVYLDVVPEFELKPDWKFGLMLGTLYQLEDTRVRRLPVGNEPIVYSALTGKVEIDPGLTFKLSPYFTLENLTDGVHFQARYTYLRHGIDRWHDRRADKSIASYLDNNTNVRDREILTKWRSHFFSFQVMYDAAQALQKRWKMDPLLYVTYDLPIGGSSIAKMHQLSLGARLHF